MTEYFKLLIVMLLFYLLGIQVAVVRCVLKMRSLRSDMLLFREFFHWMNDITAVFQQSNQC